MEVRRAFRGASGAGPGHRAPSPRGPSVSTTQRDVRVFNVDAAVEGRGKDVTRWALRVGGQWWAMDGSGDAGAGPEVS